MLPEGQILSAILAPETKVFLLSVHGCVGVQEFILYVSLFWQRYSKKKNMQLVSLEQKSLVCLHCNHTPVSQKYETIDGERGGD